MNSEKLKLYGQAIYEVFIWGPIAFMGNGMVWAAKEFWKNRFTGLLRLGVNLWIGVAFRNIVIVPIAEQIALEPILLPLVLVSLVGAFIILLVFVNLLLTQIYDAVWRKAFEIEEERSRQRTSPATEAGPTPPQRQGRRSK